MANVFDFLRRGREHADGVPEGASDSAQGGGLPGGSGAHRRRHADLRFHRRRLAARGNGPERGGQHRSDLQRGRSAGLDSRRVVILDADGDIGDSHGVVSGVGAGYRVREDREFFEIPFPKAAKMIEEELFSGGVLKRKQGRVMWFNESKGYGFIRYGDQEEIFVHITDVISEDVESVEQGQKVEFDIKHTGKGMAATRLILVDE